METRRIGSLSVSVVGLGCNNFGRRLDAKATAAVVHAALDAGINFFDTADCYGDTLSEQHLGAALKQHAGKAVVATKFGIKLNETMPGGAKAVYVSKALDDSLRRLNLERIDLYQLHRPDAETPITDTLEALTSAVQAGKVGEIGCSNFSVAQLAEAEAASKTGARFVSVQNHYSMLEREPENGVLAECTRQDLAFLPYFPLANGLLTGKYRKGQALPKGTRLVTDDHFTDEHTAEKLERAERLIGYAEAHGHTVLQLAFSWLLAQPTVASVIAGATKAEQVTSNAAAPTWKLSQAELAEIDGLLGVAE